MLREAGLGKKLGQATFLPGPVAVLDLVRDLQEAVGCVRQQNLAAYKSVGPVPWLVLGERLRWLIRTIEARQESRPEVLEARAWAALAFTYGRDPGTAAEMIRGVRAGRVPRAVGVILGIVELTGRINRDDFTRGASLADALQRRLAGLGRFEQAPLRGMVLGTIGRFWLHRHRLDRALPFLRGAVRHHAGPKEVRHELARSRTYLANALRRQGRLAASLAELDRALLDVRACEGISPSYARTTSMFVRYERARTLLATACAVRGARVGAAARRAKAEALEAERIRTATGWQPHSGLLRTLVWIHRTLGEDEEAARMFERLERQVGRSKMPAERRILAEARGEPREDGEVF